MSYYRIKYIIQMIWFIQEVSISLSSAPSPPVTHFTNID